MTRVLFVCTGNVHRSVLAERLLAARLPPGSALRPQSAGTQARPWSGMEASTRAVLEELGGDGSGFIARPLTARLVAGATLVLGLAREHREAAVRLAPSAMRRCFTLKEFVRLAVGGADEVRGGESAATAQGGVPDGEVPRVVDGFDAVVAATAGRRGATAPVPPAEDDISDPWGRPHAVLYGCAREIDGAVSTLARLLAGGASV
ncbi:low molecular weight phosphatase family protein [Streptomyces mirabilis]|uniref:arsenate reductase/protein-tyrosine-phosphatase family protein n=1 Tax=Streptomyces mirabilis TaxID=68239 RepID=UPI001BAFCB5F|nr:low molecular weight phosphatase family protein [Streptomyces mirabilis]QUW80373.1 low molecular weight phosphatase family protein [Streptomyces mirabilis]